MKRTIFIAFLVTLCIDNSYSQKWDSYLQFGIGTGYLMDADIHDTPLLQLEYGKTYKWFDIAAALEYAQTYNKYTYMNKRYLSLLVKTKFDIVRMFTEGSRHAFKLGVGAGIGTTNLYAWHNIPDNPAPANYILSSVMASYEYRLANKHGWAYFLITIRRICFLVYTT